MLNKRAGSTTSEKHKNFDKFLEVLQSQLRRTKNVVVTRDGASRNQFYAKLERVYTFHEMDDLFEQLLFEFQKREQPRYFQKLLVKLNQGLDIDIWPNNQETVVDAICTIAKRYRDRQELPVFFEIVNHFQETLEDFELVIAKVEKVLTSTVAENSPVADPSRYFEAFGYGVTTFLENKTLSYLSRTCKTQSTSQELLLERRIWVFPGTLPADLTAVNSLRLQAKPEANFGLILQQMKNLQSLWITTTLGKLPQLPASLTVLGFTDTSELTEPLNVPVGLKDLTLPPNFNLPLIFPNNSKLTRLQLGKRFNQAIVLPPKLTHFTVGKHFQQAPVLPPTLTHLTVVGDYYPVWSTTTALTHLVLNGEEKETMGESRPMPGTLLSLSISNYPHPISKLPDGLQKLLVYSTQLDFSEIYPHLLPDNLKVLKLHCVCSPPYLIRSGLEIPEVFDVPHELEVLELGDKFNSPIYLPDSLKKLKLGNNFNQKLDLNLGLIELWLGDAFQRSLTLPHTLQKLRIGARFNKPLLEIENTRLTYLELGNAYDKHFQHHLPKTLTELTLGCSFKQNLREVLPEADKIQKLQLGGHYRNTHYTVGRDVIFTDEFFWMNGKNKRRV